MCGLFVTWVFISRGMSVHTIKWGSHNSIAEDLVLLGCDAVSVAICS